MTDNEKKYRESPALSQSDLALVAINPTLLKAKMDGGQVPKEESSGFKMGSMLDCKIFTPEEFEKNYCMVPEGLKIPVSNQMVMAKLILDGIPNEEAYKQSYKTDKKTESKIKEESQRVYGEIEGYVHFVRSSEGKTPYTEKEGEVLVNTAFSVMNHPKASELLLDKTRYRHSWDQFALYWRNSGLDLKGLPDRLIADPDKNRVLIVDLKTTGKPTAWFDQAVKNYRYYRQLAHYKEGAEAYLIDNKLLEVPSSHCLIVAVHTEYPFECSVFELHPVYVDDGAKELNELKALVRWHKDNDKWDYPKEAYENDGIIKLGPIC